MARGRRRKLNINDGKYTLLWDDFVIVRHAKVGDVVTLSDGHDYEVVDNVTRMNKRKGREY